MPKMVEEKCRGYLIFIKSSGENGSRFPIKSDSCLIGKDAECDVRLRDVDENVKDRLCLIKFSNHDKATIHCLCPENPVLLNNNPVIEDGSLLENGDIIQIINRKLKWEQHSSFTGSALGQNSPKIEKNLCTKTEQKRFSEPIFTFHQDKSIESETENNFQPGCNNFNSNEREAETNVTKETTSVDLPLVEKLISASENNRIDCPERPNHDLNNSSKEINPVRRSRKFSQTYKIKPIINTPEKQKLTPAGKSCLKNTPLEEKNRAPSREVRSRFFLNKSSPMIPMTSLERENISVREEENGDVNYAVTDDNVATEVENVPKEAENVKLKDNTLADEMTVEEGTFDTTVANEDIDNSNIAATPACFTKMMHSTPKPPETNKSELVSKFLASGTTDTTCNGDGPDISEDSTQVYSLNSNSILVSPVKSLNESNALSKRKKELEHSRVVQDSPGRRHHTRNTSNILKKTFEEVDESIVAVVEKSLTTPEKSIVGLDGSSKNPAVILEETELESYSPEKKLDTHKSTSGSIKSPFESTSELSAENGDPASSLSLEQRDKSGKCDDSGLVARCSRNLSYISPPENNKSQEFMDSVVNCTPKKPSIVGNEEEASVSQGTIPCTTPPPPKEASAIGADCTSTPKTPGSPTRHRRSTGIVPCVGTPSDVYRTTKVGLTPTYKSRFNRTSMEVEVSAGPRDSFSGVLKSSRFAAPKRLSSERKSTPLKADKSSVVRDSLLLAPSPILEEYALECEESQNVSLNSDSQYKFVSRRRRLAKSSFGVADRIMEESDVLEEEEEEAVDDEEYDSLVPLESFEDENSEFVSTRIVVNRTMNNDSENALNSSYSLNTTEMPATDGSSKLESPAMAKKVIPKSILTPLPRLPMKVSEKSAKKVTFINVKDDSLSTDASACNMTEMESEFDLRLSSSALHSTADLSSAAENTVDELKNVSEDEQLYVSDKSSMMELGSLSEGNSLESSGGSIVEKIVAKGNKIVKRLSSERKSKSPRLSGGNRLLNPPKSPKCNYLNVSGVKRLMKTPEPAETPKIANISALSSKNEVSIKEPSPRNKSVADNDDSIFTTPVSQRCSKHFRLHRSSICHSLVSDLNSTLTETLSPDCSASLDNSLVEQTAENGGNDVSLPPKSPKMSFKGILTEVKDKLVILQQKFEDGGNADEETLEKSINIIEEVLGDESVSDTDPAVTEELFKKVLLELKERFSRSGDANKSLNVFETSKPRMSGVVGEKETAAGQLTNEEKTVADFVSEKTAVMHAPTNEFCADESLAVVEESKEQSPCHASDAGKYVKVPKHVSHVVESASSSLSTESTEASCNVSPIAESAQVSCHHSQVTESARASSFVSRIPESSETSSKNSEVVQCTAQLSSNVLDVEASAQTFGNTSEPAEYVQPSNDVSIVEQLPKSLNNVSAILKSADVSNDFVEAVKSEDNSRCSLEFYKSEENESQSSDLSAILESAEASNNIVEAPKSEDNSRCAPDFSKSEENESKSSDVTESEEGLSRVDDLTDVEIEEGLSGVDTLTDVEVKEGLSGVADLTGAEENGGNIPEIAKSSVADDETSVSNVTDSEKVQQEPADVSVSLKIDVSDVSKSIKRSHQSSLENETEVSASADIDNLPGVSSNHSMHEEGEQVQQQSSFGTEQEESDSQGLELFVTDSVELKGCDQKMADQENLRSNETISTMVEDKSEALGIAKDKSLSEKAVILLTVEKSDSSEGHLADIESKNTSEPVEDSTHKTCTSLEYSSISNDTFRTCSLVSNTTVADVGEGKTSKIFDTIVTNERTKRFFDVSASLLVHEENKENLLSLTPLAKEVREKSIARTPVPTEKEKPLPAVNESDDANKRQQADMESSEKVETSAAPAPPKVGVETSSSVVKQTPFGRRDVLPNESYLTLTYSPSSSDFELETTREENLSCIEPSMSELEEERLPAEDEEASTNATVESDKITTVIFSSEEEDNEKRSVDESTASQTTCGSVAASLERSVSSDAVSTAPSSNVSSPVSSSCAEATTPVVSDLETMMTPPKSTAVCVSVEKMDQLTLAGPVMVAHKIKNSIQSTISTSTPILRDVSQKAMEIPQSCCTTIDPSASTAADDESQVTSFEPSVAVCDEDGECSMTETSPSRTRAEDSDASAASETVRVAAQNTPPCVLFEKEPCEKAAVEVKTCFAESEVGTAESLEETASLPTPAESKPSVVPESAALVGNESDTTVDSIEESSAEKDSVSDSSQPISTQRNVPAVVVEDISLENDLPIIDSSSVAVESSLKTTNSHLSAADGDEEDKQIFSADSKKVDEEQSTRSTRGRTVKRYTESKGGSLTQSSKRTRETKPDSSPNVMDISVDLPRLEVADKKPVRGVKRKTVHFRDVSCEPETKRSARSKSAKKVHPPTPMKPRAQRAAKATDNSNNAGTSSSTNIVVSPCSIVLLKMGDDDDDEEENHSVKKGKASNSSSAAAKRASSRTRQTRANSSVESSVDQSEPESKRGSRAAKKAVTTMPAKEEKRTKRKAVEEEVIAGENKEENIPKRNRSASRAKDKIDNSKKASNSSSQAAAPRAEEDRRTTRRKVVEGTDKGKTKMESIKQVKVVLNAKDIGESSKTVERKVPAKEEKKTRQKASEKVSQDTHKNVDAKTSTRVTSKGKDDKSVDPKMVGESSSGARPTRLRRGVQSAAEPAVEIRKPIKRGAKANASALNDSNIVAKKPATKIRAISEKIASKQNEETESICRTTRNQKEAAEESASSRSRSKSTREKAAVSSETTKTGPSKRTVTVSSDLSDEIPVKRRREQSQNSVNSSAPARSTRNRKAVANDAPKNELRVSLKRETAVTASGDKKSKTNLISRKNLTNEHLKASTSTAAIKKNEPSPKSTKSSNTRAMAKVKELSNKKEKSDNSSVSRVTRSRNAVSSTGSTRSKK